MYTTLASPFLFLSGLVNSTDVKLQLCRLNDCCCAEEVLKVIILETDKLKDLSYSMKRSVTVDQTTYIGMSSFANFQHQQEAVHD